jgi:hypothetical protein
VDRPARRGRHVRRPGRLLAPSEIGLATLAVAVVGLLAVVADLGMTTFLVQADEADRRTTSTVFWTALGLGCLGAVLVALTAGPVSEALDEPAAAPVLRALAGGLVLTSLTVVPAALLLRGMRFRAMAGRGVGAALVSAAVGIALAVAGAGVWALVAQNLTQNAVSLVWFWALARWRPSLTFSRPVLREAWRFGSALLGINLVQALRDRADGVVIGSLGGLDLLGYWAVATRLLGLLHEVTMSVMDHVALPLFVRVRDDMPRFLRGFEAAGAMSTAALAPLVAVLAAVSPVLVPGLFGEQWVPSVLPAQLLAVAYGVGAVGYFNRSALLAFRRPRTAWAVAGRQPRRPRRRSAARVPVRAGGPGGRPGGRAGADGGGQRGGAPSDGRGRGSRLRSLDPRAAVRGGLRRPDAAGDRCGAGLGRGGPGRGRRTGRLRGAAPAPGPHPGARGRLGHPGGVAPTGRGRVAGREMIGACRLPLTPPCCPGATAPRWTASVAWRSSSWCWTTCTPTRRSGSAAPVWRSSSPCPGT